MMIAAKKNTGPLSGNRRDVGNTAAGKKAQLEAKQYQRMRQAFFDNILLLGFDKEAHEKKDNVIYNEDTFVVANNKGALTVLYFLLSKLDPDECKTRLRNIWPVLDKKQEQAFRKEICSWLNEIALKDSEANFTHLNPSLFLSPGGYRFQGFLFQFSNFVMLKCFQRDCGVSKECYLRRPVLKNQAPQLTDVQVNVLKNTSVRHMRSYVDNVKASSQVYSKWHEQAGKMVKNHRELCKKVRALERKEKENLEEKESTERWIGDELVKDEYVKTARADWLKFRKIIESQNEECEIIKSILQNLASHCKIDMNTINARIPDLLLRVQEHQIQEQQIDNLFKEGKLNLVSLVKLLNLSLEMYYDKLKSVGIPDTKENIVPIQQKSETHAKLLQNMQTLRENMKERLHVLKTSVQESAEEAAKKAIGQKLLPMEFTLNAPTPPRNFQLLCDRSIPVDSPLTERHLAGEAIDTPEAAKKIQLAAKENALKVKDQNGPVMNQLSPVPEVREEKKSKLPLKVTETLCADKDSTPLLKNSKSSFRNQIRSLRVNTNPKRGVRSKSMSEFPDNKGVDIWADQVIDHMMGVTDVDPQNITEALSMDAFKSRDKLARSPVKSCKSSKKFSPHYENIPEIEIDTGTPPSSCQRSVSMKSASSFEDLCGSPAVGLGDLKEAGLSALPAFAERRRSGQSEKSFKLGTPSPCQKSGVLLKSASTSSLTDLYSSPFVASLADTSKSKKRVSVSPAFADRRQSCQSEKSVDLSLESYLQLPSNHDGLDGLFGDPVLPKIQFSGSNSRGDASDCMTPMTDRFNLGSTTTKDVSSQRISEQQEIDGSDYYTPLKQGLHLKRTAKTLSVENSTENDQSFSLDTSTNTSMNAYSTSLRETEDLIFEDEDPVFLVP